MSNHPIHRRTNFVTHVGEKFGFQAIGFFGLLSGGSHFLFDLLPFEKTGNPQTGAIGSAIFDKPSEVLFDFVWRSHDKRASFIAGGFAGKFNGGQRHAKTFFAPSR